jgi:hypothetical protein
MVLTHLCHLENGDNTVPKLTATLRQRNYFILSVKPASFPQRSVSTCEPTEHQTPEGIHLNSTPRARHAVTFFLIVSPRMQQSVRGISAAMLAGNDSDMQGIHPVMYLL